jgi:hypothetical protein
MHAAASRTPTWLMVVMVATLAVVISIATRVLDAGAKKKKGSGLKTQTVTQTAALPSSNTYVTVTANCPNGSKVTGGGVDSSNNQIGAATSAPSGNGWKITAFGSQFLPGGITVSAVAVCAKL